MNTDFRLSVGYFEHPKVQKLERRLGAEGVLSHLRLLRFVSQYKPDGNLSGMDAEEVGMAGGFKGEAGTFVDALISLRLLDKRATGLHVHDWADHNPYAAHAEARTEKARKAADVRWGNARPQYQECSEHDLALPQASLSNAPSPTPIPTPIPTPVPEPYPTPERPITIDPLPIAELTGDKNAWRRRGEEAAPSKPIPVPATLSDSDKELAEADPGSLMSSLRRAQVDGHSMAALSPATPEKEKPMQTIGSATNVFLEHLRAQQQPPAADTTQARRKA